jgi:hypothetical protein
MGVEEGCVGFNIDAALNDDVIEREMVVVGELSQSVAQRGVEEMSSLETEWRRREVDAFCCAGFVIGKPGYDVPKIRNGRGGRSGEGTDSFEADRFAEGVTIEFIMSD